MWNSKSTNSTNSQIFQKRRMELLKLTAQTVLEESVRIALKQKTKTWAELKHILHIHHLELLGRSAQGDASYLVHKKHVLEEWSSIDDYIIGKLFHHIPVSIGKDNKKYVSHLSPHLQRETGEVMLSLDKNAISTFISTTVYVANEFPYNVESPISHDYLWSLSKLDIHTIEKTQTTVSL